MIKYLIKKLALQMFYEEQEESFGLVSPLSHFTIEIPEIGVTV